MKGPFPSVLYQRGGYLSICLYHCLLWRRFNSSWRTELRWQICWREDERSKRKLDSQNGMVLEINVCVNVFSFLFRTLYIYTVHSVNHEHTNRHLACRKDEQGQTCQIYSSFHGTCPDSLTDQDREVCTQEPGQYSGPLADHLMAEKWAPSAEDKCKVYWTRSVLVCTPIQDRNKRVKDRPVSWWSLLPVGQTFIWGVLYRNICLVCPGFVHKTPSEPLHLLSANLIGLHMHPHPIPLHPPSHTCNTSCTCVQYYTNAHCSTCSLHS